MIWLPVSPCDPLAPPHQTKKSNSSFDLHVHVCVVAWTPHILLWTSRLTSCLYCSLAFLLMYACLIYASLVCPPLYLAPFPSPRLPSSLYRASVAIVGVFRPQNPRLVLKPPSIHLRSLRVLIQLMEWCISLSLRTVVVILLSSACQSYSKKSNIIANSSELKQAYLN